MTLSLTRNNSIYHSFRLLIYVNKQFQFRQIHIPSLDVLVEVLKMNDETILVASVYVPRSKEASIERNEEALRERLRIVSTAWEQARQKWSANVQLFVGRDFNRYDQMWGGDSVACSQR